jgi:glycosyltransferase involved in cell wall biosynthesis
MPWAEQCAAVIPCLNEAAAIGKVVAGVRRYLPQVWVVDDGSEDGTAAEARAAGAQVLRHEISQGKGAALQHGWRAVKAAGFDWALTLDGDGQHATKDIPAFFESADRTGARLISGNRMGNTRRMPPVRRVVNWWMSRQLSKAAGTCLPDTQCGFRLMNLSDWAALPVMAVHFEIESEILIEFARAGHRIGFVPIQVIYQDERSKINPLRDTVRWFRWWRKNRRAGTGG